MASPNQLEDRLETGTPAWQADWDADTALLEEKSPYADVSHYRNPSDRQSDLLSAEKTNIARAARALGKTSIQWRHARNTNSRSPERSSDFPS